MNTIQEREAKLFKLSEQPEFAALIDLLRETAFEFHAPMPRKSEERVAFETSSYVEAFSRHFLTKLQEEIEVGKSLSTDYNGEKIDAKDDGHRRPRA
jgi:hypothetical protein